MLVNTMLPPSTLFTRIQLQLLRAAAAAPPLPPPQLRFVSTDPRKIALRNRKAAGKGKVGNSASLIRASHPWHEETLHGLLDGQPSSLTLWLDGVQDPHNLGACLRTADGAGCVAVITPKRGAVGLTATVTAVSAGAAQSVPVIQVGSISRAIKRCRKLYGMHFLGPFLKSQLRTLPHECPARRCVRAQLFDSADPSSRYERSSRQNALRGRGRPWRGRWQRAGLARTSWCCVRGR